MLRRNILKHLNGQSNVQYRVIMQLTLLVLRNKGFEILHDDLKEKHLLFSFLLFGLNAADHDELLQQD